MNRNTIAIGKLLSGFQTLEKIIELESKSTKESPRINLKEVMVISQPFRSTLCEILMKDWKFLSQERKKQFIAEMLRKKKEREAAVKGSSAIGKYIESKK